MACIICDKLGEHVSAEYTEGESLPDEVMQLDIVPGTNSNAR